MDIKKVFGDVKRDTGIDVASRWKDITMENLERQEVGEVICRVDDEHIFTKSVIECRGKGGKQIVFFHNHPSRYDPYWGEKPRLSVGDIGWGISNKMPCMCIGEEYTEDIVIKCFCTDKSEDELEGMTKEILTCRNVRDTVERINPYIKTFFFPRKHDFSTQL